MLPKETKKFLANLIGWERAWKYRHWIDPRWSEGYINLRLPYRKILAEKIMESSPQYILEIGCGMGANLKVLREMSATTMLCGLDVSPYIIKRAKDWLPLDIHVYTGTFEELLHPDRYFDVVFTADSFMYAKDKRAALKKMADHADRVIMYEWKQFLEVTK